MNISRLVSASLVCRLKLINIDPALPGFSSIAFSPLQGRIGTDDMLLLSRSGLHFVDFRRLRNWDRCFHYAYILHRRQLHERTREGAHLNDVGASQRQSALVSISQP